MFKAEEFFNVTPGTNTRKQIFEQFYFKNNPNELILIFLRVPQKEWALKR